MPASARQAGLLSTADTSIQRAFVMTNLIKVVGLNTTPFLDRMKTYTPDLSKLGSVSKGYTWFYDGAPEAAVAENEYLEGSSAPAPEHFAHGDMTNHFQISKHSYGVTGSQKAQQSGSIETLDYQKNKSIIALKKDINKAMITNGDAVMRDNARSVKGRSFGLGNFFGSHNEIDAGGAALSPDMLEEICTIAGDKGVSITHAMCASNQRSALNKMMRSDLRGQFGNSVFAGENISVLKNIQGLDDNAEVEVFTENNVAKTDLILYCNDEVGFVTLREEFGKDISTKGDDAEKYLNLFEWCLWVATPMSFLRIKNLKV